MDLTPVPSAGATGHAGQAGFSGLFCCSAGFLMKLTESNQPAAERREQWTSSFLKFTAL